MHACLDPSAESRVPVSRDRRRTDVQQERFRTINELGIRYVGLDFEHVCAQPRADLAAAGIADRNITFLGNASGTYLFNLIRLAKNRETFDIIYLDGSHSIYVDLAAAIAAVRLLTLCSFSMM